MAALRSWLLIHGPTCFCPCNYSHARHVRETFNPSNPNPGYLMGTTSICKRTRQPAVCKRKLPQTRILNVFCALISNGRISLASPAIRLHFLTFHCRRQPSWTSLRKDKHIASPGTRFSYQDLRIGHWSINGNLDAPILPWLD